MGDQGFGGPGFWAVSDPCRLSAGSTWQLVTLTVKGTGMLVLGELSGGSTHVPHVLQSMGLLSNLRRGAVCVCGGLPPRWDPHLGTRPPSPTLALTLSSPVPRAPPLVF